jgi:hypothetical protein
MLYFDRGECNDEGLFVVKIERGHTKDTHNLENQPFRERTLSVKDRWFLIPSSPC